MAVRVEINSTALRMYARTSPKVQAGLDRLAGRAVVAMKAACPVSPVMPVYAYPVPLGGSVGPAYRGRGLALPGGPGVTRRRYPGDLPLRPSGHLRNSVRAFRTPDGGRIIGATADYARYVNDGTRPHLIRSHGNWPLRNRASGQVFGPLVHHPGTRGAHFVEKACASLDHVTIHLG